MSAAGSSVQKVLLSLRRQYEQCDDVIISAPIISTLGRHFLINPAREDETVEENDCASADIVNSRGSAMVICMTEGRKGMKEDEDLSKQELWDIEHTLEVHLHLKVNGGNLNLSWLL